MNEKKYFIANDKGEIVGHDLDYNRASDCLAEMQEKEPTEGWEILEQE